VLDALRFFPDATNAEIALKLGWPVNRITPRCLELRKMGLILDAGPADLQGDGIDCGCMEGKISGAAARERREAKDRANDLFQLIGIMAGVSRPTCVP